MRVSNYDIPKKHIKDFTNGNFSKTTDENKVPMITLTHKYFMEILTDSER